MHKKLKEIISCLKYFLKFAWKEKPSYFAYVAIFIIINSVGPFISIIGTKYLVNEIAYEQNRNINVIIFWTAFICLGTYLYRVINKYATERRNYCNTIFGRSLLMNIGVTTMTMKFEYTENTDMLDKMNRANKSFEETNTIDGLVTGITQLITQTFVLLGVFVMVIQCSGWLLIPIFLSFFVSTGITKKINDIREEYFKDISDWDRLNAYLLEELTKGDYAKDIRIYDSSDMIIENQTAHGEKIYRGSREYELKMFRKQRIMVLITELCNIWIYGILGVNTLLKRVTIGDFSSLIQAVLQFTRALNSMSEGIIEMRYSANILKYYIEYMDSAQTDENLEKSKTQSVGSVENGVEIEFKNVSFKYPNTDKYILKNVSTVIHKGEHLSIVGKNGAGKTTFIKLLCRLYDVTEGEILVNGVNINDVPYSEYLKLLSVVFQDYRLMAFSVRENVACGDDGDEAEDKIKRFNGIVGIDKWIDSLEKGIDTNLYKMFDEAGVEPSGGQAQKLAIVRALYKDAPVVILDEPTAALDPLAEYEVYNNFDRLVGNKTAVYISHRLSSCRFCDRIIVFDGGGIIEDGSHEQLMGIENGFYRNMYGAQAKHYN